MRDPRFDRLADILASYSAELKRNEKVLIEASKQPGFSIDELRKAYREQDEIH